MERIQKRIAASGLTSRRKAEELILEGRVKVNGEVVNSLGCIPKPPIPNQLLLPFLTLPIPGIKTRTKSIKQINKIILEYL